MEITTFKPAYLPEMAAIFASEFRALRATVPALHEALEDPAQVIERLRWLFTECGGVVAVDGGRVIGYLGWIPVEHFRDTDRKGAYIPEWGHGAVTNTSREKTAIYRALHASAAPQWAAAGCGVYAITLLAHDRLLHDFWFWNGFGLMVVDAMRSTEPINASVPEGSVIRKATSSDVPLLMQLDLEHARHYADPPVLMQAYTPISSDGLALFIDSLNNAIWIAVENDDLIGFMRFEAHSDGSVAVVEAPDKIAITGAFVKPQTRGRGVAAALLDAGLRDYAAQGFIRCSVDFESFNPTAREFWLKYFAPVSLSVARIPERQPEKEVLSAER